MRVRILREAHDDIKAGRLFYDSHPYAIFYDKSGSEVTVVAVLDCRRDPLWVARRLPR